MLLLLAFVCFAGALIIVGQLVTRPARERQASLRRAQAYADAGEASGSDPLLERLNDRYAGRLARFAGRLDPRATEDRIGIQARLGRARTDHLAGRLPRSEGRARGSRYRRVRRSDGRADGQPVQDAADRVPRVACSGFSARTSSSRSRTRTRRDLMRRELPDALDVLAVSVEAGLGFDAALAKLGEYLEGPLVEEFLLVLAELRIGESRSNALRKMADRVDIPELTAVVNSLIQAEQLGSPLGQMLRVQAQEARNRRQVAAEEQAMKAPVKMLLPTASVHLPGDVRRHPRPGDAEDQRGVLSPIAEGRARLRARPPHKRSLRSLRD